MFANRFTAIVDACVLVSPLKRNLILSLAEAELFRVRWSKEILDEFEAANQTVMAKEGRLDSQERATRARSAMVRAFADANVDEYDAINPDIGPIPDEGDRHVIAAAIKCRADVIVTENLKDFPESTLSTYCVEAKSADDFIADAIDLSPAVAIAAIRKMRQRLKNPAKTAEILLLDLERLGLTKTADYLRESVDLL